MNPSISLNKNINSQKGKEAKETSGEEEEIIEEEETDDLTMEDLQEGSIMIEKKEVITEEIELIEETEAIEQIDKIEEIEEIELKEGIEGIEDKDLTNKETLDLIEITIEKEEEGLIEAKALLTKEDSMMKTDLLEDNMIETLIEEEKTTDLPEDKKEDINQEESNQEENNSGKEDPPSNGLKLMKSVQEMTDLTFSSKYFFIYIKVISE
jgi:hypothetical protein